MGQIQKWLLAVAASSLSILITACSDLSAVREWSKTSLEATQYNELITTYSSTPERIKRYDLWCYQSQYCTDKPHGNLTQEQLLKFYKDLSEERANQKEALQKILTVVSNYMATLAILSADSTVNYDKDFDALTRSFGKIKDKAGISDATLGAVGSLVKAVTIAATKAYQAKQVKNTVELANDPLQAILGSELKEIVDIDFRNDLRNEERSIDRYYDYLLQKDCVTQAVANKPSKSKHSGRNTRTSTAPGNCLPDAVNVSVDELKEKALEENNIRLRAIDAYLVVLNKISAGHQKLYENRNNLDEKALANELYPLIVELREQIKTLAQS